MIIKSHRSQPPPPEYTDVPTFWEFVEYLQVTPVEKFNEHWRPYYITCTPCHHHYSAILHLETLSQETYYLAEISGLPELIPKHDHMTKNHRIEMNLSMPSHENEKSTTGIKIRSVIKGIPYYSTVIKIMTFSVLVK